MMHYLSNVSYCTSQPDGEIVLDTVKSRVRVTMEVPTSLQSLLVKGVDRLEGAEMLACKLAAVMGQKFPKSGLRMLFVSEGGMSDMLDGCLNSLVNEKILTKTVDSDLKDDVYDFQHSLMQQACYDLLLHSQRTK
jgi:predicted ATPase